MVTVDIDSIKVAPESTRSGRCKGSRWDVLAADASKVKDALECGVNAAGKQRMPLLHYVERVMPLLDGWGPGDLGCKRTVERKVLIEEAVSSSKAPRGRSRSPGRSSSV